ncbi:APC family permease [Rhodococcoides fascians]|uniref:APC family permease n=1 Tax=Rhodococcoides fascians TaxID=1828 RepID=UPI00068DDD7F|nr:APC family permease [Rhodococcus fascians]
MPGQIQDSDNTDQVQGLQTGTLSMRRALGLTIVVFSPVLSAATVGTFVAGAGSSGWLSVLCGAIMIACIGLCIVPFARRYVVSGALYSYIGHAFGNKAKLLSGASLAVGYLVGVVASLGALGLYLGSLLSNDFGLTGATGLLGQSITYIVVIALAGLLTYGGLDASARLSIVLLILSAPVVAVVLVANTFSADFDFASQFTFNDFSFSGFTVGIVLSATFLVGFEACAATAAETKDPLKSIPKILTATPLIVGAIGVAATLCTIPSMGALADKLAAGESPLAAMAENAGLGWLSGIADMSLVLTCFAIVVGYMNFTVRVWATMSVDGILPSLMGKISPRTHTPVGALIVLAILSVIVPIGLAVVTGGTTLEVYTYAATLFPYLWVVPYALVCVGAVVLLRRTRELTPMIAVSATIGTVGVAWMYVNSIVNKTNTPIDHLAWVAPAAIALTLFGMLLNKSRTKRHADA